MSEVVAGLLQQPEHVPVAAVPPPPAPRAARPWGARVVQVTFANFGARLGMLWIAIVATLGVFAPFLANSHPVLMKVGGRWSSPMWLTLSPWDVALVLFAVVAVGGVCADRDRPVIRVAARSLLFTLLCLPILWWPQIASASLSLIWVVSESHLSAAVRAFFAHWMETFPWTLALFVYPIAIGALVRWTPWTKRSTIVHAVLLSCVMGLLLAFPVRPTAIDDFGRYRELERGGNVQWIARAPIPFSPTDRLRDSPYDPAGRTHPWPPSREHWMGTEVNHSDIASRMIHACRIAMTLGFISTGLSTGIGIVVGAITGYFAGWVDLIGQRLIEVFSAIPTLFLMLAAVAFFGRGLYMMMLIIGMTSWVGVARFVRAEFLRYRQVDFVQAARALGLPLPSILFRHLLPNALAPVLVEVSFGVAGAILSESGLSFLGLGLIDEPSWGALLNQAVGATGGFLWWLAIFPGAAIFLTVMAYNLIGESLRDALDPKLLQRE